MMYASAGPARSDCIAFAVSLLCSAEIERTDQIQMLLLQRQLSKRVHELNELLDDPVHRDLAAQALASMGFAVAPVN